MDPIILMFLIGFACGILKIEVELPKQIYAFVVMFLLITIGMKGGVELHHYDLAELALKSCGVICLGVLISLLSYPILRKIGKLDVDNSASIAAHYGSVSVGTFSIGIAYLQAAQISFESYIPLFAALLEIPAIIVGVCLAKGLSTKVLMDKEFLREVFFGKSIAFLIIGVLIGALCSQEKVENLTNFFFMNFKGALSLFLLQMGLVTSREISSLKKHGTFLIFFGVLTPIFCSFLGASLAYLLGLSEGGAIIMAILAASSSYIAAPAAMQVSLPNANTSLSLGTSLGVTFPFNVLIGIPLYHQIVSRFFY